MPTLYDNCLQVTISFLKRHGYLNPEQWRTGTITWSSGEGENKEVLGQINISVNTYTEPYLALNYNYRGNPVNYRVQLISVPSNLCKGVVWFFICPYTGKWCRKLYCVGEKFLHREAFSGCMYEKQTFSKPRRRQRKLFDTLFARDDILGEIDKPYFKAQYNSKPTKRYLRLLKKAEQVQQISVAQLLSF